MALTPDDIQALLETFEASTWQELTVDIAGDHLHVSRRQNGLPPAMAQAPPPSTPATAPQETAAPATAPEAPAAPAPAPRPPTASPPPPAPGQGVPVTAPCVGLFWRSPSPGAPPFTDIGSRVGPDDTIAIIEVMKLMSPLKAGLSGVVTAILAENGATVTRGEPLVLVDPDA